MPRVDELREECINLGAWENGSIVGLDKRGTARLVGVDQLLGGDCGEQVGKI